MGIGKSFFQNAQKPEGFLGKVMVGRMNKRHAKLSDWGLAHLKLFAPLRIADLGCGGGRNIKELRRMFPQATVAGVDHSAVSVEKAQALNHGDIVTKRCQILEGDVSALPFDDASFDLVTAFETVYFWPGPIESFREVYRILQPNGLFMIVNESDGEDNAEEEWSKNIEGLRVYDKMALIRYLKEAGFNEFSVDQRREDHWLCIIARK